MDDLNVFEKFVEELSLPLHQKMPVNWVRRAAKQNEACLAMGVRLEPGFTDPQGRLDTAYDDFNHFLDIAGIKGDSYTIVTTYMETSVPESYHITVQEERSVIRSADTEGIRRALVYLEDEVLRSGGPFLPIGEIQKSPVIKTRISRCFFGPINRPPKNRDELEDDINYYPDEYLNRMAHHGINGLWITLTFRDTVPSEIIPEYGTKSAGRLEKLRLTVERCARYGIKVYAFCIEPFAFAADSPVLAAHPELGGHRVYNSVAFCTSTEKGKSYLEEATSKLFSLVPGLGGLIVISVGERLTHCYSYLTGNGNENNCPRCSKKLPREVLSETLSAMERGMHSVAPDAELISWPYSQYICWGDELTCDAAAYIPPNVALMHNFESAGGEEQLGKWRRADDYWLSYIGPSNNYRTCAEAVVKNGGRMFAKLQVGCSHEVATVPFVPVPGNIFKKFHIMHALGVSGVMESWYFGNYPSVMTKAAGELSFTTFPKTEDEFLLELAGVDWGINEEKVVEAWKLFQEGYRNYPLSAVFGYYGPMHDGPVWPLYLEPRNLPLSPTWKDNFPPSGDRIGECILYNHTLEEVIILCTRMAEAWTRGVELLQELKGEYSDHPERIRDINVAEALGLQFRSGLNILRFYALREEIAIKEKIDKIAFMKQMEYLVKEEISISSQLLELVKYDSRLGFHSEAEGYKYFPEKIHWRIAQLNELLGNEFPRIKKRIAAGLVPFPAYTGEEPQGKVYTCRKLRDIPEMNGKPFGEIWDALYSAEDFTTVSTKQMEKSTIWKAGYHGEDLYIGISCKGILPGDEESMEIHMEPKRLWPHPALIVRADGSGGFAKLYASGFKDDLKHEISAAKGNGVWSAIIKLLGFKTLHNGRPAKLNIVRKGRVKSKWVLSEPLNSRLIYEEQNPDEFGWLDFE